MNASTARQMSTEHMPVRTMFSAKEAMLSPEALASRTNTSISANSAAIDDATRRWPATIISEPSSCRRTTGGWIGPFVSRMLAVSCWS